MANFMEISDFAAPELDVYARLTENQLLCRRDPENAMFIAESPMVIERALDVKDGYCEPRIKYNGTKFIRKEKARHSIIHF